MCQRESFADYYGEIYVLLFCSFSGVDIQCILYWTFACLILMIHEFGQSIAKMLMKIEMVQSFDHGYYLLVKSIQELREKKDGLVTVGIGGPCGSGKTR